MNCRKCGEPLNGATVCPKCGTSIGYVLNNPTGADLGSVNNNSLGSSKNNLNGYVNSNNSPVDFGMGVAEPTGGAFNKNYSEGADFKGSPVPVELVKMNTVPKKKEKKIRGFTPLHKEALEEDISETGASTLVNFTTTNKNDSKDSLISKSGTKSKDEILNELNNDDKSDGSMTMDLPDDKKTTKFWLIAGGVILAMILLGVYILPLFTDVNYSKYEKENVIIKYKKDWVSEFDTKTNSIVFFYKNTGYKIFLDNKATFSELKYKIRNDNDKKVLYNEFYNLWSKSSGGKLVGGSDTFLDLEEDDAIYAKIDYVLDNNAGVGSFYVVICEKYDVVLYFKTFCLEKDKVQFEKEVMEFINGIDYLGLTALEKEQEQYMNFQATNIKKFNIDNMMKYSIPDAWTLDEIRTASINNRYNIFEFKDKKSLLEVKALKGYYTYQSMKDSAISSFGAIQKESKLTINGKVWYVIKTPDYDSGGYKYHNELYFTISPNNENIYYAQVYLYNETSNDSVKRKYFDDSIKYILNNMDLNNKNN